MITNERAQGITRAAAARFRDAIAKAEAAPTPADPKAARRQATVLAGHRAQLAELERDLAAYERMKRGDAEMVPTSIEDLGTLLIQARVSRGWTQKELAARVGIFEQRIQLYERNGYATASLTRLQEVVRALGATVTSTLALVPLATGFDQPKRRGSPRRVPARSR